MILMLHMLPRLSLSLLCTKEDLRCGFKLTWCRNGPESKDYKGVKALAFCAAYCESFVSLLLPLDKGDVELPELPVQALD